MRIQNCAARSGVLLFVVCLAVLTSLVVAGCGGGGAPAPAVTLAATATTLDPTGSMTVTAAAKNDASATGVTFALTGCGGNGCGTITATGAFTATYNAPGTVTANETDTITATIVPATTPPTISQPLTVTDVPGPKITTPPPQTAVVGQVYSFTFAETGGVAPFTWSLVGPAPPWLSIGATTGTVTGTPPQSAASTTVTYHVQITDSGTPTPQGINLTTSLQVNPAPLTITATLPQATIGTAYSQAVNVSGGTAPYTWGVSGGALPNGLGINTSTGVISGTPLASAVTSSFQITVTDSTPAANGGPLSKNQTFTIAVTLVVTTTSLPNGAVNTAYSGATLAAEGGTPSYTWSVTSGALPAGLTLNASTGAISGPVAANATTQKFTVTAMDSTSPAKQSAMQVLTIFIPLAIETPSLPPATIGTAYNQTVAVGGGSTPYHWGVSTGTLPDGLTINPSTGAVTGTPKADAQSETFSITVTDASTPTPQSATQSFSIFIPLTIETTTLPSGTVNVLYNQTVNVGGGTQPYTWVAFPPLLPPGLALNPATGAITGTPTATGSFGFTVTVTDSTPAPLGPQTANQALTIVITMLAITPSSPTTLPTGTIGTAYSQGGTSIMASGGTPPYTYLVVSGNLPAGLSISPMTNSTGVVTITGTPTSSAVDETFVIQVTDSSTPPQGATTGPLTLPIALAVTTTSPLPNGTVGVAYSQQINAEGGQPPYAFAVDPSGSALPTPLGLSGSGLISGTPTATSTTNNIIIDVTDSATTPQTVKPVFSLTITTASACTTTGGSESLLNGGYAFLLKGSDSSGEPALVGGVLTFNGTDGSGLITAGAIDMNLNSGVQSLTVTSGTYGVGSDHRGCMAITTSAGTQNYAFSVGNISGGVASTAHVIDFDSTGPFTTGTMLLQSSGTFSNASFSGTFAFGASSIENSAAAVGGGKFAIAGALTSNGSGGITSGSEDINQNGVLDGDSTLINFPATSPITFSSSGSSYTMASNGRGTLTIAIDINGVAAVTSHNFLYGVSSSHAFFMTSDAQTGTQIIGGEALLQSGTPFTGAPLSGSYTGYDSGTGSGAAGTDRTDLDLLGPFTSGSDTLSGTQQRNDAGVFSSSAISGTYSVSQAGRMLIAGTGTNHQPVLYLVNTTEAFLLNGNPSVDSGFVQSQTGTSASGTYAFGIIDPAVAMVGGTSGVFTLSAPNITGASDSNSSSSLTPDQALSSTYSIGATGLGLIPASCTPGTNCQLIFYVVSPTRAILTELQHSSGVQTHPGIATVDQ